MNSPLYLQPLIYFVDEFPYAFIESNSLQCIIFLGQDFQNKVPSIILLISYYDSLDQKLSGEAGRVIKKNPRRRSGDQRPVAG